MVADSTEKLGDIDKKAERVNQKMLTMQDKFENLLKTTSNNTLWIIIIINIFVLVFLVCAWTIKMNVALFCLLFTSVKLVGNNW